MSVFPLRRTVGTIIAGLLCAACTTTAPPPQAGASRAASVPAPVRPKPVLCVGTRESTRRQREVALASARRAYFSKQAKRRTAQRRRRRHRYVAVRTESNTDSVGVVTCMVFDTQTELPVSTLVFDCDRVPQIGENVKFVTYNATYVGG